ncbi:hypothetical protein LJB63_24905, partial [[Eubacterium] rectale]|nr:hypothetical protein [Agathobacter rectalis]
LGGDMITLRVVHQNGNRIGAFFQKGRYFITESRKPPSWLPAGFPLTETSETMLAPPPRMKYLFPGLGSTGRGRE